MDTYDEIYEEYPELRDLRPRHPSRGRKKRKMKNTAKLMLLLIIMAAVLALVITALAGFGGDSAFVYSKDGEVLSVKQSEVEKYLAEGWYAHASDIVPVTLYGEDGSVIYAAAGDVGALQEKGYSTDKSAAFTTLYSEDGETLYVPKSMASGYKKNGWTDKLSDVVTALYKSDGSKLTVAKGDVEKYVAEGWTNRLLDVAKKMTKDGEEDRFVFNDEVDAYSAAGWTVVKRVVDPDQPMVALTFDDGPGKYTTRLLDCLDQYNSAATFFTLGKLVETYPDVVKRAAELGCEISNHTWDHTNLTTVSAQEAAEVIQKTSDAVKKITGKPTPTYRPCYGSYNNTVLGAIDMPAIMWSIDTLDWKTKNADSTYNKIMSDVYDGAIILMHDIHEPTVDAALRVIPDLIEQGYQLVTVQELMEYKRGGMESGKVYFDAFE